MKYRLPFFLIILSSVLFGLGVVAPSLVIYPGAGKFSFFLRILSPDFDAVRQVSIAGGIGTLLREGEIAVGLVLLIFSIIFPIGKLGLLWAIAQAKQRNEFKPELTNLIDRLGKFSMLDVFVLALLVIALKKLPGGSKIELGFGAYMFAASVLLSMVIPVWLKEGALKARLD
jgi:paraquat-inducible protein A